MSVMKTKLEELRAWLDSPEGEESLRKFGEKLKAEDELKERRIQYIHDNYRDRLDEIIQKLLDKYISSDYINREYRLGYQPRETLLWVLSTYSKKYGTEFTEEEYGKYSNMFTGSMFYLGNWVFEILHGQGSVLHVYRIEDLRETTEHHDF
jgi:hypothetical protein